VMIQPVTPELKEKLGLPDVKGALVADVTGGGPAEEAGLMRGDVIVAFNDKEIEEMNELPLLVASSPVGSEAKVDILRKGERISVSVTLGKLSDEEDYAPMDASIELGMSLENLTPERSRSLGLTATEGVLVTQVTPGSPAAEAKLRQGDVVVEVDQIPTRDVREFEAVIGKFNPGDTVLLLIQRRTSTLFLTMKMP